MHRKRQWKCLKTSETARETVSLRRLLLLPKTARCVCARVCVSEWTGSWMSRYIFTRASLTAQCNLNPRSSHTRAHTPPPTLSEPTHNQSSSDVHATSAKKTRKIDPVKSAIFSYFGGKTLLNSVCGCKLSWNQKNLILISEYHKENVPCPQCKRWNSLEWTFLADIECSSVCSRVPNPSFYR